MKNVELERAEEVQCTLETPRFRRVRRAEARHYISVYDKTATRDETILEFAKLDYNILKVIYYVTTSEDVDWAFTFPKIIRGVCMVGRIGNDIVSHEREQASKHVVSTVQACMNQYGVTVEEANKKLRAIYNRRSMDGST
ncbi:hypothetical protein HU200_028625 [Digitaria exilis]|uniref:Terpene synthase metal-binding domain-containing protein n=1 Tax=Digitaria exilis TaxID=1010633 RepID=A0A835BVU9_9POAL|nr:hypothetical protein HU200_028625 [Digitaria exilis]